MSSPFPAVGSVPTENAVVYWDDIADLVNAGNTPAQIAADCNRDYRHFADISVDATWSLVSDIEVQMLVVDQVTYDWVGAMDTYHANLDATQGSGGDRQRKTQLKEDWARFMAWKGQTGGQTGPLVPAYPVQDTQQTDRRQRYGYVIDYWNKLSQDIAAGTIVVPGFAYTGIRTPAELNDLWHALSGGGRRFGLVTDVDIQAVIDDKANSDAAWSAQQVAKECVTRSAVAQDAANAAVQAQQTDAQVRAAYKAAWDGWTEPGLPYVRS